MTFDLDDTLYDNHPYIVAAEKKLFSFMFEHWPELQKIGKEGWRQFRRECVRDNPLLAHDMIALRLCVLTKLFTVVGLTGAALEDAVQRSYDEFYFQRSNFKVSDVYVEVLKGLAANIPVLAITNGNVDIERVGLGECFHKVYHASVQQRSKPYRDMFDKASAYLDIPAKNILHIGDNLDKDVFGALNAGYMAAWFADNRKMNLQHEKSQHLPHVSLSELSELFDLL